MSKFNLVEKNSTKTLSHEGGAVYKKKLEDEWSNLLFSCMLANGFYETSKDTQSRYTDLTEQMIKAHGADFVARAAHFSRNVLGLRSISELTAAILNRHQFEGKRNFYAKYFRRPDGVGEIFSAVEMLGDKRSHALIRGCEDYLEGLSEYQIGKYQLKKHKYNMHDIINLTHAYSPAINKYQNGELAAPDTWEVAISTSSAENRAQEWKRLVEERKLGYLALIRNLRNITAEDFATEEWCEEFLCSQLANEEAIKKSLVFPYQIYVSWKNSRGIAPINVELALSRAFKYATENMPGLDGDSAIILDVSGSMEQRFNANSSLTVLEVCSVYAAAIAIKNPHARIIKFASDAKIFTKSKNMKNVFCLIEELQKNEGVGYGTEICKAFRYLDQHYDRIFLFSDMQVMDSRYYGESAQSKYSKYVKDFGPCQLYSFDLGNYATQIVSQDRNIVYITTLTDMVFKAIELHEFEGKTLVDMVREYQY